MRSIDSFRVFVLMVIVAGTSLAGLNRSSAQDIEYQLEFSGGWSGNLPGGAHFSPVIGATHSDNGTLFSSGTLASTGIENVAELGSNGALTNEINTGINNGTIGELVSIGGNVGPTQTVSTTFDATEEFSKLSIVTMIAPSPDWFSGIHDLDLQQPDGYWPQQIVVDLPSYDAGTEEGTTFSLSNPPTNPQELIEGLDTAEPSNPLFGAGPIASMTLTRITPITSTVMADSANITRGEYVSGGPTELESSDNVDYSARRNNVDITSRIFLEVEGTSPATNPTAFEFTVEGSVFARTLVNQSIDVFDFQAAAWVEIDSRPAQRFSDSVVAASASGDLTRFIEPGTNRILSRIRFESPSQRQQFSANVDQVVWNITD